MHDISESSTSFVMGVSYTCYAYLVTIFCGFSMFILSLPPWLAIKLFQGLRLILCRVFHLSLLVLRTIVFLKQRSRPGSSQLSVWLPTGEITLSFTIRVLRQQRGMESQDRRAAFNIEHGTLPEGE